MNPDREEQKAKAKRLREKGINVQDDCLFYSKGIPPIDLTAIDEKKCFQYIVDQVYERVVEVGKEMIRYEFKKLMGIEEK